MQSHSKDKLEIERKFLVRGEGWRLGATAHPMRQGYLFQDEGGVVRVRRAGGEAFLTIKGPTLGISRTELEWQIPPEDAELLFPMAAERVIEKTRYRVSYAGHLWEVDEFGGANAPLVLAEIELSAEDEAFERPPWLGAEVSHLARYSNSNLARHPYQRWSPAEKEAP